VLADEILNGVGTELAAGTAGKEELRFVASLFLYPDSQDFSSRFGQWRGSFLSAFSEAAHMRADAQRHILMPKSGEFRQAKPGLHGGQQQGMIAPSTPGRSVHRRKQRFDFGPVEEVDQPARVAFTRHGEHPLDERRVLGRFQRGVAEERSDRRQAQISLRAWLPRTKDVRGTSVDAPRNWPPRRSSERSRDVLGIRFFDPD